jgi:DNA topoisomerase-2
VHPAFLAQLIAEDALYWAFDLHAVKTTSGMMLFDADGVLRRYATPEEILRAHFRVRKNVYLKRKSFMHALLEAEVTASGGTHSRSRHTNISQARRLNNQARFIEGKIEGRIVLEKRTKQSIVQQLMALKFDADPMLKWKATTMQDQVVVCHRRQNAN